MSLAPNGQGLGLGEDARTRDLVAQQGLTFLQQENIRSDPFAIRETLTQPFPSLRTLDNSQPAPSPPGVMDAFVKTCQRWRLNETQQMVLLGYTSEGLFFNQLMNGRLSNLPQDVKDRIGYVLGISIGLGSLFNESDVAELAWLNQNRPRFGNSSALDFMFRGRMANLIAVSAAVMEERAPYTSLQNV
jgi:hypothetical protein